MKTKKPIIVFQLYLALVLFLTTTSRATAAVDPTTSAHALRLVANYKGQWTSPPTDSNFSTVTNAPLLGNGDLGVVAVGNINSMTLVLNKNEFWSYGEGQRKGMTRMSLSIPGMAGASYNVSQNLGTADLTGTFSVGGNTINMTSWVQATDAQNNFYITQFTYNGGGSQTVTVSFARGNENTYASGGGSSGSVVYYDVRADSADTISGYSTPKVRTAARIIGATGIINGSNLQFTMQPGNTYTLVTSTVSNLDTGSYQTQAINNISSLTQANINTMKSNHQAWWNDFYGKSFIEIPNKTIERSFYASLYLMASTSRAGEEPPGLYGNWVARNPAWRGDYHLNYNYQVPFMFTIPTNHLELMDNYDDPVVDWMPRGQALASSNGYSGVYYAVGLGPLPNGSGDTAFHNQKTNAAFSAVPMIARYYAEGDTGYANTIYPYVREVARFWNNYLVWDGSRYDIVNDAQHEGDAYPQTNGIMSLGLVRYSLQGAIDLSIRLNLDAGERANWQNRLNNLSPYPTYVRNGSTVFRYTEVGRDWSGDNSIGIQHIYPASQIGLDSDATTLQTSRNMIAAMQRWDDGNGTNTFYPAAARVGYDPNTILTQLNNMINTRSYPNLYISYGGGGVENLNTVPATLAEMQLQSHQGKIRIFPNWPSSTNAKFGDLRANGAFLVSSDSMNGAVRYVRIVSQRGNQIRLVNPWAGQTLRLFRNGADAGTVSGSEITINTSANEIIHLAPNGTSYATILDMMNQPMGGSSNPPVGGNIALNRPVTASGSCAASEGPEKAVNGSWTGGNADKWCAPTAPSWLTVDLGQTYSINKFMVKHSAAGGEDVNRNTRNFTIQVSADNSNWSTVVTVTNNTANETTHNITAVNARYVRLNISTPTQTTETVTRIYEFEVYSASSNPPAGTNVALNRPATASGSCAASEGPEKAVNGSWTGGNADKWCAPTAPSWLTVDLGQSYSINRFVVKHSAAGGEDVNRNTRNFTIQVSTDNSNWSTVVTVTNNTANETTHNITAVNARYVRINITTPTQTTETVTRIYEFEVYNN